MVPDKFNMVDMGGIDLIMMQGEAVPGLYDKLMAAISNCRYQCLYNWLFDGVLIPPTYVQIEVDDGEVYLNEGVSVTSDNVIHIYSIEPPAPEPEIIPLLAEENGVYNVPAGKDGFNPVTVDVPSYTPVINSLSITENGTYNAPAGVDGYSPITVYVSGESPEVEPSLPDEYQEVEYIDFDGNSYVTIPISLSKFDTIETHAMWTDSGTGEETFIGAVTNNASRFDLYFSNGGLYVYTGGERVNAVLNETEFSNTSDSHVTAVRNVKYKAAIQFIGNISQSGFHIGKYYSGYNYKSRLWKIKLVTNNNGVADFSTISANAKIIIPDYRWIKPCYRKNDNVPGWYDTTADVFYINLGNGTFVVGPDIN